MSKTYNKNHTADYHANLIESLKNPDEALAYLQITLEEYDANGDYEVFMIALRNLTEAKGGINKKHRRASH